jgi:hypothetical protein
MFPSEEEREKARQEMFKRVEALNKLTLATLKSHLFAEQCLGDFLLAGGVKREWIRDAQFFDKMEKAKKIARSKGSDPMWDVLAAANRLRNTIAHSLDMEKIEEKMKQLKEVYLASLTPEQAAGLKDEPDDYIAMSACVDFAGLIIAITEDLKSGNTSG